MAALRNIYKKYIKSLDNKSMKIRIRKQWIFEWYEALFGAESKAVKKCTLTPKEIQEIQAYWKKFYGKKIPLIWHRKYKSHSGKLDVKYFPEIFFTTRLEPTLAEDRITKLLSDKNLIEMIYARELGKDIRVPKTLGGCSNGFYFNGLREPITKKQLITYMNTMRGEYIIKPTIGESSGNGVLLLQLENGTDLRSNDSIEDIIKLYGENFIIQEKVSIEKSWEKLHPLSLNTLRVMTYRVGGEIHVAPVVMRIGCNNDYRDNAHAGGIYIAVSDSGELGKFAIKHGSIEKYYEHPNTGIKFEGYKLSGIDKVIKAAINLHKCLPNIEFVNWDLCVDKKGFVVLIEGNLSCPGIWIFQNVHGKGVFGEDTEYMINEMKKR